MRKDVALTRWLIWSTFMIMWTVALEMPVPLPEEVRDDPVMVTPKLLVAKTVHVVFYAILTVLSVWAPSPSRYRWLLMFVLMTHAVVTELLQTALQMGRTGSLADVGFDVLGIAIGVALSWKKWMGEQY